MSTIFTHVRPTMVSIASSAVFALFGLLIGAGAASGKTVMVGTVTFLPAGAWFLTIFLFIMAYFTLVHMRK